MGSVNISITEDVYSMLKGLKRGDDSFSSVIRKSLTVEKDISKCYGLLSEYCDSLELVEREALLTRRQKWKEASL